MLQAVPASPTWRTHALGTEAVQRVGLRASNRLLASSPQRVIPIPTSTADSPSAIAHALLHGLTDPSGHNLPCFAVPPSNVRILHKPDEWHITLLDGARRAQRRAIFASLYLGDGPKETSLVAALLESQAAHPSRDLLLIVDYHRAQRRGGLRLAHTLAAGAPTARVALLASPAAFAPLAPPPPAARETSAGGRGVVGERLHSLRSFLGELCGVQHVKMSVFDDTVVLTGANLSHDYFTNRQDRYVVVSDVPLLADYCASLLEALARHALPYEARTTAATGTAADEVGAATTAACVRRVVAASPPSMAAGSLAAAVRAATAAARAANPPPSEAAVAAGGCWIVPMAQIGAEGLTQESDVMKWLLGEAVYGRAVESPTTQAHSAFSRSLMPLLLSSPYLNPPQPYIDHLINHATAAASAAQTVDEGAPQPPALLSSSPTACGFWGARGVIGLVPHVYGALEERLAAMATCVASPLKRLHYARPGWTFHAKGLWLWPAAARAPAVGADTAGHFCEPETGGPVAGGLTGAPEFPVLSVIGSSNHSERSVQRDVELSACMVATDAALRAQLQDEQARLRAFARDADATPEAEGGAMEEKSLGAKLARALAPRVRAFF